MAVYEQVKTGIRHLDRAYLKSIKDDNSGFTLVELVLVLVILAMLAAIITPALLGYFDQARVERERTNGKAVFTALRSKLTSLYDQGLMPNVCDDGQAPASESFSWKSEWTDDVFYTAGTEKKPYACGFACGNLGGTRIGLKGLKRGYIVYVFFYMENADSKPGFFYDNEWNDTPPVIDGAENAFTPAGETEAVSLSPWYVFKGCEGAGGSAAATWTEVINAAKR